MRTSGALETALEGSIASGKPGMVWTNQDGGRNVECNVGLSTVKLKQKRGTGIG